MLRVDIPGLGSLTVRYLLLDVNGTVSVDGFVSEAVRRKIAKISKQLDVYLVTCDTLGTGTRIAEELGVSLHRVGGSEQGEAEEKLRIARSLGENQCAAIGNGNSDVLMLDACCLGIAVLGREGLASKASRAADIVVSSIEDGLDLLLEKKRLIATLQG